jgi:FixJ family two-component response regulator
MTERPKPSHESASAKESVVLVIDDDASMCRALSNLFQSVGLKVELFGSASEMLQTKLPDVASCLLLDIRLPGLSGLDFQTELAKANIHIPIIFMTGHGDIPMSVRAMKGGAVDFLTKPFREQEMLDAVVTAIERDRKRRESDKMVAHLQALFETLTSREPELFGAGIFWPHEQTGSSRTWTSRDYRKAPSWAYHEENGRKVFGRSGENGRNARKQILTRTNLRMVLQPRFVAHLLG